MRNLAIAGMVILTAIMVATLASADSVGIGIKKTAPISGTGSSGSPLKLDVCSNGSGYESNGTSWACAVHGDIQGVTAGNGMTGTATTGTASLDVGCGTGLSCGADAITVNIAGASCLAGSAVTAISATGTGTCTAISGESTIAGAGLTLTGTTVDLIGSSDFTVGADLLDLSTAVTAPGTLAVAGASNANTLTASNTATGQTVGLAMIYGPLSGTFNTTAGVINSYGFYMANTAARSAGANNLVNHGIYSSASGGQLNYSFWGAAGEFYNAAAAYFGAALNVTGAADFDSTLNVGGATTLQGSTTVKEFRGTVISPAATGTLNDYAPTGIGTATVIDIAPTGSIDLLGLTSGALGRIITIRNANNIGYLLVIYDEGGTSVAANRFDLNGDTHWTLRAGDSMTFVYTAASRWASIGHSGRQFPGLFTTGDLSMGGASITGALNYTGTGTVATGALTATGNTTLGDANTDIVNAWGKHYYYGTAPTLTGCTTQCSMASYSTDARGRIICTDGSTAATCTVTFSVAYSTNPPSCTLQYENATADAGTVYLPTITAFSTSAFSFKEVVAGAAHGYAYHCDGML